MSAARTAIAAVLAAWIGGFPGTITPNNIANTCCGLMDIAAFQYNAPLSILPECSANNFGLGFRPNFADAERTAARDLRGTIYARYYDVEDLWEETATGDANLAAPP